VSAALRDLLGTGVDTHRVFLLPAKRWVEDGPFLELARLAETLSFRWSVTGRNAQQLESIYQEAAAVLAAGEGSTDTVLTARDLLAAKIPSDASFFEEFRKQSLGVQYVAAYALRRIVDEHEPGERAIRSASEVHIEHIMPKTVSDFWRERAGDAPYDELVQRWGNLTLLLDKLNISISNGDWDVKRFGKEKLLGYSASKIALTKDLVEVADWSASLIDLRARWLAAIAIRIWAWPSGKATEVPSFSIVASDPDALKPFEPAAS
jgi:hypothetical protein